MSAALHNDSCSDTEAAAPAAAALSPKEKPHQDARAASQPPPQRSEVVASFNINSKDEKNMNSKDEDTMKQKGEGASKKDYAAVNELLRVMEERKTPLDVLALQESRATPAHIQEEVSRLAGYEGVATGTESAIFYRTDKYKGEKFDHTKGMTYNVMDPHSFENEWMKRTSIVALQDGAERMVVISHHAPHKSKQSGPYMDRLFQHVEKLCQEDFKDCTVHLCGDFNTDLRKHYPDGAPHGFLLANTTGAPCQTQKEIDYVLSKPSAGGDGVRVETERVALDIAGRNTTHLPVISTMTKSATVGPTEEVVRGHPSSPAPLTESCTAVAHGGPDAPATTVMSPAADGDSAPKGKGDAAAQEADATAVATEAVQLSPPRPPLAAVAVVPPTKGTEDAATGRKEQSVSSAKKDEPRSAAAAVPSGVATGVHQSNGAANGRTVYTGSRGGQYYYTPSGNRSYI